MTWRWTTGTTYPAAIRGIGWRLVLMLPLLLAGGLAAQEGTESPAAAEPAAETLLTPAADDAAKPEPFRMTPEFNFEYTINSLIMFICAVLVLFMQSGFAMLEIGLSSHKNTANILFKNLLDTCIGIVLYATIGYAIMYPGGDYAGKWFGYSGSSFVSRDAQAGEGDAWTVEPSSAGWSNSSDFLFQAAFAATAATIVSGAVAGRIKLAGYLICSAVLTGLIYPISGMWKWGGGALAEMGFADFAGSIVVHSVGGFAALAGAMVLGPRIGRFTSDGRSVPMPGHSLPFAALGVFILWIGWYGFNPGSQLTYAGVTNAEATTYIAVTTTFGACAGGISAMLAAWLKFGKPELTMSLNGVLAGLVGVTANCDRISQVEALIIGAVAGLVVFAGVLLLEKLKIDDPVGAFPVHGMCGIWGGLATGIFGDLPDGITTQGEFFLVQLKSTVVVVLWAFVTSLVLFLILKAVGLLRVPPEEEAAGLDIGEHGNTAYPEFVTT